MEKIVILSLYYIMDRGLALPTLQAVKEAFNKTGKNAEEYYFVEEEIGGNMVVVAKQKESQKTKMPMKLELDIKPKPKGKGRPKKLKV